MTALGGDLDTQVKARALGDKTRYEIFRHLANSQRPLGVKELTEHVGLNHNAVRQHLAILKEAGLIQESREHRSAPGRPRLLYSLAPEAAGSWETPGPYTWLAMTLSQAMEDHCSARDAGKIQGERLASSLKASSSDGAAPEDLMELEMARFGFRPTRITTGTLVRLILTHCPFAHVAQVSPDTVCQVHLGMAEGLAKGFGGLEVERLVVRPPGEAGCRLVLKRLPTSD
jgi:predicted ArsR family transcriptional regulator